MHLGRFGLLGARIDCTEDRLLTDRSQRLFVIAQVVLAHLESNITDAQRGPRLECARTNHRHPVDVQ